METGPLYTVIVMRLNEVSSTNVIHKSRWAVTQKCGNIIRKIFLHDEYPKIRKEVLLLQLSLDSKATLSFDDVEKHWVCESEYMDLFPIVDSTSMDEIIPQLKAVFRSWADDGRYCDLIADEWSNTVIPWYCWLLQQYLPDEKESIAWLQDSRAEHFVHGDFTLSNVYLDGGKQIVVIDFENATLGPFLWDETTLIYSLIEHEQYAMARQVFEVFSCKREMLHAISSVRLAQSIRKSQNVQQRAKAHTYISRNY